MAEFDTVFTNPEAAAVPAEKAKRKDAWKVEQDNKRTELFEMANDMLDLITRDENVLRDYLSVQARFLHYSPTNALLIMAQNPNATMVRTARRWKENGVYYKPNDRDAIYILDRGAERTDEHGNFKGYFSNPKAVYDIASTGRTLEAPNKPDMKTVFAAMYKNSPVPIVAIDSMPRDFGGAKVAYDPANNIIHIEKGLDADTIFKGLSQEMSMAAIANKLGTGFDFEWHEHHAQCASYMLCELYGVDNSDYDLGNSFAVVEDQKELRSELDI